MKISFVVAALLVCAPVAASAQAWTPTADELVNKLQPKAGGADRGIRAITGTTPAPIPTSSSSTPARPVGPAALRPVGAGGHAAATASPAAPPAEEQGQVNLTVQFETGSDRLTPAAMHLLDELGRALSSPQLASYKFRIVGHTDSVGSRDANQALSERRASAVTTYIASRFNVDRSRLSAVGVGQAEPLVPVADGTSEARNRRVQVINTGT